MLVEEAGDAAAPALKAVLEDWRPGDATLVVTAGGLGPGGALRKAFEAAKAAVAIGVYADPPGRDEVEAALAAAGLARRDREAFGAVGGAGAGARPRATSRSSSRSSRSTSAATPAPLTAADIEACAPPAGEPEIDAVVALAADGEAGPAGGRVRRARRQPDRPDHRRRPLLPDAARRGDRRRGLEAGLARARPPVFGPRRARMAAQARAFGPDRLERALGLIVDTELVLRSSRPVPAAAAVERLLVRLAMLRRGRERQDEDRR